MIDGLWCIGADLGAILGSISVLAMGTYSADGWRLIIGADLGAILVPITSSAMGSYLASGWLEPLGAIEGLIAQKRMVALVPRDTDEL